MKLNKPVFKPFNPHECVEVYRRHLPHWRQEGACYFVTWRLNDSIPIEISEIWKEERESWLAEHGVDAMLEGDDRRVAYERVPFAERREIERLQHRKFHDCLDAGHGACSLRSSECAGIVLESLFFFNGERCWTGDAVIMPNHVHALITPLCNFSLEHILQSIKKHTAVKINKLMGRKGQLWQRDSHDHIVRNAGELRAFRKYIAKNAAQTGLELDGYAYRCADWLDEYAAMP
ncbi:MAG: transposase [Kiritimatiellia bacterium]